MTNRVLIAPLNWGLGHATRCIPIIDALIEKGFTIHIASDGKALALLKEEYPLLTFHTLPGYNVKYYTHSGVLNMGLNSFKIVKAIIKEQRVCNQLHRDFQFRYIISDNRYGCYIKDIPSYFLTHQVHLPVGNIFARFIANGIHHRLMTRFDEVVIPDNKKEEDRLAGKMSKEIKGRLCRYIGPLSRFFQTEVVQSFKLDIDFLVVLSGPEPQRTNLENELIEKLVASKHEHILIVRGLPDSPPYQGKLQGELFSLLSANLEEIETALVNNRIVIVNYLLGKELFNVLKRSNLVLTRSGYTTVMDLFAIQKKAIYVPTPGQPEQEFLATNLDSKQKGWKQEQGKLLLKELRIGPSEKLSKSKKEKQVEGLRQWISTLEICT